VVQVINMLNTEELMVLLVNELIMPRTFHVKPTQVMYVSGLGRIDYVEVIMFTCTCCPEIVVEYNNNNKTVLQPFIRDYPGEPVPEETLTHPPS